MSDLESLDAVRERLRPHGLTVAMHECGGWYVAHICEDGLSHWSPSQWSHRDCHETPGEAAGAAL